MASLFKKYEVAKLCIFWRFVNCMEEKD